MGLIFEEGSNVMLSTGADVMVVIVMGAIMLFFLKSAREYRRGTFLYLAVYMSALMGYMMFYAAKASKEKRQWKVEEYEWVSFAGIYTVSLMAMMGGMQWMRY